MVSLLFLSAAGAPTKGLTQRSFDRLNGEYWDRNFLCNQGIDPEVCGGMSFFLVSFHVFLSWFSSYLHESKVYRMEGELALVWQNVDLFQTARRWVRNQYTHASEVPARYLELWESKVILFLSSSRGGYKVKTKPPGS